MSKYSVELKMRVVKSYLNKEGGCEYLAKKYGISSKSVVSVWVNAFKSQGYEGLKVSRKNNNYSFEFKQNIVKLYLTGEMSYQELANQFKINNPSMIARWIVEFRNQGFDGLRPKKNGIRGRGRSKNERMARIIHSLREKYPLKNLLKKFKFPKSTYMYWQKRFDRQDKEEPFEDRIKEIRKDNPNYGYRRIHAILRRLGVLINKKKGQRLIQKLKLQVTNFAGKSRKYYSYKGQVGKVAPNRIERRFNTGIAHQKITTDTSEFKYYEYDKTGNMQVKNFILIHFWICITNK